MHRTLHPGRLRGRGSGRSFEGHRRGCRAPSGAADRGLGGPAQPVSGRHWGKEEGRGGRGGGEEEVGRGRTSQGFDAATPVKGGPARSGSGACGWGGGGGEWQGRPAGVLMRVPPIRPPTRETAGRVRCRRPVGRRSRGAASPRSWRAPCSSRWPAAGRRDQAPPAAARPGLPRARDRRPAPGGEATIVVDVDAAGRITVDGRGPLGLLSLRDVFRRRGPQTRGGARQTARAGRSSS